ncbi:hypothetical protein [Acinetobacter nectaris]|uniref:hypothetical protein n=1 Tax=Acinetobacter nectaris TaxID=1219382 RepID=UPI001F27700B|nr:hypothetical protein [Acinetobacter nectaris]MCF9035206.1 hypothetical protein [Acinetobacter nectaris]
MRNNVIKEQVRIEPVLSNKVQAGLENNDDLHHKRPSGRSSREQLGKRPSNKKQGSPES